MAIGTFFLVKKSRAMVDPALLFDDEGSYILLNIRTLKGKIPDPHKDEV